MANRNYNENPEGVSGVWREFHKLQKELRGEIEEFRKEIKKPRLWSLIWAERSWLIPTLVTLALALSGGVWYFGSLVMDSHIQRAAGPISDKLNAAISDISGIKGTLSVLQAQIALQKYSAVSVGELRNHQKELSQTTSALAAVQAKNTTPNFWPVCFQAINLLSQANSDITIPNQREGILDNVSSNPPGAIGPVKNQRVVLRNLVAGITFINSIVRFDPNVRLANDTFINCTFIFPDSMANPPKALQEIGATLLTSDISKTTITTS